MGAILTLLIYIVGYQGTVIARGLYVVIIITWLILLTKHISTIYKSTYRDKTYISMPERK